jgi:DNA polymerase III subunit delta'
MGLPPSWTPLPGSARLCAMSFTDFPAQQQVIQLLQRSLERRRLGNAYLFSGSDLDELEGVARSLAKTLNCLEPRRGAGGTAIDCCDACLPCRKIDHGNHGDVHWVRPEAKTRVVKVEAMRDLIREVNLKPVEAEHKVAIIAGADRMNASSANAFLKTLEEPPARSVLILLSTDPQHLLETILSRCLRLSFAGSPLRPLDSEQRAWLEAFAQMAGEGRQGLLGRYQLLGTLAAHLSARKDALTTDLEAKSPLNQYSDLEPDMRDRMEEELKAAIESEYRRQRADLLAALQWWLRDVWLLALKCDHTMLACPALAAHSEKVAGRIQPEAALKNLDAIEETQRILHTNVQEALALEVGLLKLAL